MRDFKAPGAFRRALRVSRFPRQVSLLVFLGLIVGICFAVLLLLELAQPHEIWVEKYDKSKLHSSLKSGKDVIVLMMPTWDVESEILKSQLSTERAKEELSKSNIVTLTHKYKCWSDQTELGSESKLNPRDLAVLVFSKTKTSPIVLSRPSLSELLETIRKIDE